MATEKQEGGRGRLAFRIALILLLLVGVGFGLGVADTSGELAGAGRIALWFLVLSLVGFLVIRLVAAFARSPKKGAFSLLTALLVLLVVEGACQVSHRLLLRSHRDYRLSVSPLPLELTPKQREILHRWTDGRKNYLEHSSSLGWDLVPEGFKEDGKFTTNTIGARGPTENTRDRTPGVERVVCCGDSFTYCAEVADQDAWPYLASRRSDGREYINLGVSAYGLTQSYLRYQERGVPLDPDIVLIGFMTENIRRSVNAYRPFVSPNTSVPLTKPYSGLNEEGRLVIHPPAIRSLEGYRVLLEDTSPELRRLAEVDYYGSDLLRRSPSFSGTANLFRYLEDRHGMYRQLHVALLDRYPPGSSRLRRDDYRKGELPLEAVTQLFQQFAGEVESNGARPLIVIFPKESDLKAWKSRRNRRHQSLIDNLAESGLEFIEVTDWIFEHFGESFDESALFQNRHYTPEVNAVVADRIHRLLEAGGPSKPPPPIAIAQTR